MRRETKEREEQNRGWTGRERGKGRTPIEEE